MLISERIQLIIKANNESPSSFADKIGIQRSSLSHVISGRNKPSLDFLSKIIRHYPKVNASWLITGVAREGEFEEETIKAKVSIDPEQTAEAKHSYDSKEIERIVVFYLDGTFKPYTPNEQ
jgi:transcriptional regulator with XRE-family HTH domain